MADLATDLPPAQRLALAYGRSRVRSAFLGLFALDALLAAILQSQREPIAAQLRLAWWREMLARPAAEWPRGEPALDLLRDWRDPSGLARLAEGWEVLLEEDLTGPAIDEFAAARGHVFGCLAAELGCGARDGAVEAGRIWALADLAANVSNPDEKTLAVQSARDASPPLLPATLRPLAVLAGLGARALRLGGAPLLNGPASALLALRVGLGGR